MLLCLTNLDSDENAQLSSVSFWEYRNLPHLEIRLYAFKKGLSAQEAVCM